MADETKASGMIKVSCFLKRRPDLTHAEFYRYWTEVHTPMLAKPVEGGPRVHRYVQLHPLEQSVPGLRDAGFDGVAEIWMESLDDAAAMFNSEHYNTVVAKDEENFLDRSKTTFLYAHEARII